MPVANFGSAEPWRVCKTATPQKSQELFYFTKPLVRSIFLIVGQLVHANRRIRMLGPIHGARTQGNFTF